MVLSLASEPVPAKLVAKVQSGAYTDVKEFLADNIPLVQQLEMVQMVGTTCLAGIPQAIIARDYFTPVLALPLHPQRRHTYNMCSTALLPLDYGI